MKKEGQKGLTSLRRQKPLKRFKGKQQISCFESLTDRREREGERERKAFEKFEKVLNTCKANGLKKKKKLSK